MLIKSVNLNNCFPSANSQKVSCCILYPEGKWKLCAVCGNYFLLCCSFLISECVKRVTVCYHEVVVRTDMGAGMEGGGISQALLFYRHSNFFQTLWFYMLEISVHNLIDLPFSDIFLSRIFTEVGF
jgi:hypothetical protein